MARKRVVAKSLRTPPVPLPEGIDKDADEGYADGGSGFGQRNYYHYADGSGDDPLLLLNGGRVYGKGGPTEDKQPAMISPKEYVLPADTADAVGRGKLDALRAATHKFVKRPPGLANGPWDKEYNPGGSLYSGSSPPINIGGGLQPSMPSGPTSTTIGTQSPQTFGGFGIPAVSSGPSTPPTYPKPQLKTVPQTTGPSVPFKSPTSSQPVGLNAPPPVPGYGMGDRGAGPSMQGMGDRGLGTTSAAYTPQQPRAVPDRVVQSNPNIPAGMPAATTYADIVRSGSDFSKTAPVARVAPGQQMNDSAWNSMADAATKSGPAINPKTGYPILNPKGVYAADGGDGLRRMPHYQDGTLEWEDPDAVNEYLRNQNAVKQAAGQPPRPPPVSPVPPSASTGTPADAFWEQSMRDASSPEAVGQGANAEASAKAWAQQEGLPPEGATVKPATPKGTAFETSPTGAGAKASMADALSTYGRNIGNEYTGLMGRGLRGAADLATKALSSRVAGLAGAALLARERGQVIGDPQMPWPLRIGVGVQTAGELGLGAAAQRFTGNPLVTAAALGGPEALQAAIQGVGGPAIFPSGRARQWTASHPTMDRPSLEELQGGTTGGTPTPPGATPAAAVPPDQQGLRQQPAQTQSAQQAQQGGGGLDLESLIAQPKAAQDAELARQNALSSRFDRGLSAQEAARNDALRAEEARRPTQWEVDVAKQHAAADKSSALSGIVPHGISPRMYHTLRQQQANQSDAYATHLDDLRRGPAQTGQMDYMGPIGNQALRSDTLAGAKYGHDTGLRGQAITAGLGLLGHKLTNQWDMMKYGNEQARQNRNDIMDYVKNSGQFMMKNEKGEDVHNPVAGAQFMDYLSNRKDFSNLTPADVAPIASQYKAQMATTGNTGLPQYGSAQYSPLQWKDLVNYSGKGEQSTVPFWPGAMNKLNPFNTNMMSGNVLRIQPTMPGGGVGGQSLVRSGSEIADDPAQLNEVLKMLSPQQAAMVKGDRDLQMTPQELNYYNQHKSLRR